MDRGGIMEVFIHPVTAMGAKNMEERRRVWRSFPEKWICSGIKTR
jgi:hypothetical protein